VAKPAIPLGFGLDKEGEPGYPDRRVQHQSLKSMVDHPQLGGLWHHPRRRQKDLSAGQLLQHGINASIS